MTHGQLRVVSGHQRWQLSVFINQFYKTPSAVDSSSACCISPSHLDNNYTMVLKNFIHTLSQRYVTNVQLQNGSKSVGAQMFSRCFIHAEVEVGSKEGKEQTPHKPASKPGPGTMSRSLVKIVKGLSNIKEEVYAALDEWAAFELEFPLVATRKGLETLRQQGQWHRVIQVTKWMLSKGLGKTNGSYSLLLKAYCMEGRLADAEALWDKLVSLNDRSMPKNLFAYMTNVYRRKDMPEKVIKVFEQMEGFGIKPDVDLLRRAREAYELLGMQEKIELLIKNHPLNSKERRNERRIAARQAAKALRAEQRHMQSNGNCLETNESITTPITMDDMSLLVTEQNQLNNTLHDDRLELMDCHENDKKTIQKHMQTMTTEDKEAQCTSLMQKNSPLKSGDPVEALSMDDEFVKEIIATM